VLHLSYITSSVNYIDYLSGELILLWKLFIVHDLFTLYIDKYYCNWNIGIDFIKSRGLDL